jgi:ribonuclease HI
LVLEGDIIKRGIHAGPDWLSIMNLANSDFLNHRNHNLPCLKHIMVAVYNRCYYPPSIGDQTPNDIFEYDDYDGFTYILKRSGRTIFTTRNIAIFVDGACAYNGTPYASAGTGVYFGEDSWRNLSQHLAHGRATSQRAEIWAAIYALREVEYLVTCGEITAKTVVLVSDSAYVVNAMTDWVEEWRQNGWRSVNGKRLKNVADLQILDQEIEELEESHGV